MAGKIERVPLRKVWKHEAYDFSQWLQDNIDVLSEVLDIELTAPEREQPAGTFSVDVVAEDTSGNLIIIENQLEKSNHDHLGKLITYLVAMGAKAAIWIVSEPRPEHVSAITWLNESSAASFYLLKLEAITIGESEPAPLLTLIVGPSEESREVGKAKKELAERHVIRYEFWAQLIGKARTQTKLHANISPSRGNWISAGAGKYGLGFGYVIRQHSGQVELYIDRGRDAEDENKSIFDSLYQNREAIENTFGEPLDWQRLDGKRACRIRKEITAGGYRDNEKLSGIQDDMIDKMIRLSKALKPFIAKLKI